MFICIRNKKIVENCRTRRKISHEAQVPSSAMQSYRSPKYKMIGRKTTPL